MPVNILDKNRLLNDLKSREFRQVFYAEHISADLPIQTRELRKQRGLSQAVLAALIGTDQKNISDWENPNYEYKPQIGTLMRLADAFDVPLIVRFGSWEELLDWEFNLSPTRLTPQNFEQAHPKLARKYGKKNHGQLKDTAQLSLPLPSTETTTTETATTENTTTETTTSGNVVSLDAVRRSRREKASLKGKDIPEATTGKIRRVM